MINELKYIFKELSLPQLSFSTSLAMNFLWKWRAIKEKLYYHACRDRAWTIHQMSALKINTKHKMVNGGWALADHSFNHLSLAAMDTYI